MHLIIQVWKPDLIVVKLKWNGKLLFITYCNIFFWNNYQTWTLYVRCDENIQWMPGAMMENTINIVFLHHPAGEKKIKSCFIPICGTFGHLVLIKSQLWKKYFELTQEIQAATTPQIKIFWKEGFSFYWMLARAVGYIFIFNWEENLRQVNGTISVII